MKIGTIQSSWMKEYGYRLDCSPYLGGALEMKVLLGKLTVRKDKLHTLTAGRDGGIYNGPKFSRTFVDSPEYGVPFMGGSSMLSADLTERPLLSRRQAGTRMLRHLELKPGMTLISCSGRTIGKTVYARRGMAGMWSSQHILKVVPNPERVLSGYLYAFLSSRYGIPLTISGTYGSIIKSIGPEHIADLPVPRFGEKIERKIHELVEEAAELRTKAATEINDTTRDLCEFLRLPVAVKKDVRGFGVGSVSSGTLNCRLDATYHSPAALDADEALRNCSVPVRRLSDPGVAKRLFKPPLFKRLWVDDTREGVQFISGNDAYGYEADNVRYVSYRTPDFAEFIVHEGWVIFQAAGQIHGLFARPLFVRGWLNGLFVADDMYRIVPNDPIDGAYLFSFLRTEVGQVLVKRQSAGNSIPRVWDPQMNQLLVPWPDRKARCQFGGRIVAAHEDMERALRSELRAVKLVEDTITNPS